VSAGNRLFRGHTAGGPDGGGREELPGTTALMRSAWRKSSYSAYNGNCLEVAEIRPNVIGVRDTKDAGHGPVLVFEAADWRSFLDSVKTSS